MKDEEKNSYRLFRRLVLLTTIPVVLLAGPVIGFYIGDYIDKKLNTAPWFMIIFLLLGFAASVRQTIILITSAGNKE